MIIYGHSETEGLEEAEGYFREASRTIPAASNELGKIELARESGNALNCFQEAAEK